MQAVGDRASTFTSWQPRSIANERNVQPMDEEQLSVKQTATGYWIVKRGAVELAGAVTRQGAEAERELMRRLGDRSWDTHPPARRVRRDAPHPAMPPTSL
jgi:hypothetical protein